MKIILLLLFFTGYCVLGDHNNVCPTITGYLYKDIDRDCFYNPDVYYRAPQLITSNGYKFETHHALTKDGYNLTMFRIFHKENCTKGIVYLQHPITASCELWIDKQNQSFAFLLAERGYEVWLGNFRGVSYSIKHVRYSPSDNAFWNFSFHEYGIYDIPAMTDKIRSVTGSKEKFFYFGQSASTSAGLVYASLLPKHAEENYNLLSMWAVIAHLEHVSLLFKVLAAFSDYIMQFFVSINYLNLLPHYGFLHRFIIAFCVKIPINVGVCMALEQVVLGKNWKYNLLWYPSTMYHNFDGFSAKVLYHYGQIAAKGGRFQFFDYKKGNFELYNSSTPPLYPMEYVRVPLLFVCLGHDNTETPEDCQYILEQVPEQYRRKLWVIDEYNHVDVFYSKTVAERLYLPSIDVLDQYNNSCSDLKTV